MKKFVEDAKAYAHNLLVMLTQSFNVLTGGMPDETFCSRMWRRKQEGSKFAATMVVVLNTIFCYEPNHCKDSYLAEVQRRHEPEELKDPEEAAKLE